MPLWKHIGILFCAFAALSCSRLDGNGLPKIQAKIGGHPLLVEVAANEQDRNRGLMFRKSLAENEGMIFVWPDSQYRNFWMKNTLIPLDIAFFDEQMFLINIHTMKPDDGSGDYGDYRSAEPARYAIEVNAGWYKKHGIKKYARLQLERSITAEN